MKKTTLALFIIFICIGVTNAQVAIGLKGGVNLSNIGDGASANENNRPENLKPGFNVAAAGDIEFTSLFSMYGELGFSSKGGKFDNDISVTHNYIQLAVLPRLSFGTDLIRGYVNAGPTIGYFLGGSYKFEDEKFRIKRVPAEDLGKDEEGKILYPKEYTNWIEVSLSVGGGVIVAAGPGNLMLDLRYDWGLTNQIEDYNSMGDKVKNKNRTIGISLGYLIPLNLR